MRGEHIVTVRMYNVGFGDAFVVTVRHDAQQWRMLVDCGVHNQGRARPLDEVVNAVIADLAADTPNGVAHLDVIVATHHHADHIAGFALDAWRDVTVGEVWVPFVENPDDPDAVTLRQAHAVTAARLLGLLDRRTFGVDRGAWPEALSAAHAFAANSSRNEIATDRLLGRDGLGFANTPTIRYLPSTNPADNVIATTVTDTTVQVLGPSRDAADLKRMNPPTSAGWLALDSDLDLVDEPSTPLFNPALFELPDDERLATYPHLTVGHQALRDLDEINDDALLAAASILERSVNNTSVFFVLDVAGAHLLFPGDAQQGAWDHVLDDPAKLALVSKLAFLKISHHGSHNGTPRRYIEQLLEPGTEAMLPWARVNRWAATIPKQELIDGLQARQHRITRADAPVADGSTIAVDATNLWSQLTLTVPCP